MYIFLLVIHVAVCLILIFVVLLQAGRGGGFSDMMGGGQPQSLFGTQTNAFMVKATEVCAVIFIITSLSLAIMSTQRGKSLVTKEQFMKALQAKVPAVPQPPQAPPQAPTPAPTKAAPAQSSTAQPAPAPAAGEPAEGGSAPGGNAS